jgi:conjugative relaxase-like TrwC/TraI family protein
VTARVTTLRGAEAGAYYVEKELGYYLDDGEPPGQWRGNGAAELGLDGLVVDDDFLALIAGLDPRTGDLLGTGHTERTVRGFDVTCSAPKSVSVLFALGDDHVRDQTLAAHDAAVDAVIGWIEEHAHTRFRVQGEVCTFDADGIVAARFRQHTSRELDPQLHTHVVIANRVQAPDGRWLALDARTIKRDQQTLSRLYHVGLRAELTHRLGVRWVEPENGIAEIADVSKDVLAEFSQRTRAIKERIDDKIDAFVETLDRQPTPRERWRIEREAAAEARPGKTDTDPVALRHEWQDRTLGLGFDPTSVIESALDVQTDRTHTVDLAQLADIALAALAERQSTWRHAELVRELAAAVPTNTAGAAQALPKILDELADRIIAERMIELSAPVPDGMPLRRDGRPLTEAATDRRLTLPEVLEQEERLLLAAQRRLNEPGEDRRIDLPDELTIPQRQLASAVAGTHQLVVAVGPAGSGKTSAIAPAVNQLRADGRPVFGVAPSATAAEVLADGTGIDADTLDRLLIEHRLDRPPDHRYNLPPATTIICDEAGMVPTAKLAELFALADQKGWRLALVGDPLQFAPVGRGGMFGLLVDTFDHIDLDQIHRFNQGWERAASLQLRRGDTSVVDLYDAQGRLHGGTARQMQRSVIQAWWEATQAGVSVSMMAPTNDAVIELNHRAQLRRLRAGSLGEESLEVGPYDVRIGDLISTRENNRRIRTDRNLMVKNRDHWTVEQIHHDGSLTVSGKTGQVQLPPDYVARNVELAYAETSHANQGRTVDRSFLYLDSPTDCRGIYVPLSRGRDTNEAFVVVEGEQAPADVIIDALARDWIDRPALQVQAELQRPACGVAGGQETELPLGRGQLVQLLQRSHELSRTLADIRKERNDARREADGMVTERRHLEQSLQGYEARLTAAQDTIAQYDRPLNRRKHRVELDAAHTAVDQLPEKIATVERALMRLDRRQGQAADRVVRAEQLDQRTPHLMAEHTIIQDELSRDIDSRGRRLATHPPAEILDRLGPCPSNSKNAHLWIDAAGKIAQHDACLEEPGIDVDSAGLVIDDDVLEVSRRTGVQALQRLDRAIEQERLAIEPPGLELGLSL